MRFCGETLSWLKAKPDIERIEKFDLRLAPASFTLDS